MEGGRVGGFPLYFRLLFIFFIFWGGVGWLRWSLVGDRVEQWREGGLGAFSFISIFYLKKIKN